MSGPGHSRDLIPSSCLPLLFICFKCALIENYLLAKGTTQSHRHRGSYSALEVVSDQACALEVQTAAFHCVLMWFSLLHAWERDK